MGQAKVRGTFEERKAAAIKSGKKSFYDLRLERKIAEQTMDAIARWKRQFQSQKRKK